MMKDWQSERRSAYRLAAQAHKGQKYGDWPYIEHCLLVAERASSMAPDGSELQQVCYIVGMLHDVLEDTDVAPGKIAQEFGSVVEYVCEPLNRKGKAQEAYIRAIRLHPVAKIVKVADTLENLIASVKSEDTCRVTKYTAQLCELTT